MPKLACITTVAVTQWAFFRGQNRFLTERGFEIHAIASPGVFLERVAERDGVATHPVTISRSMFALSDIWALFKLFWLLRKLRPEIVHISTPKAALLGSLAAWAARVPIRIFFVRGLITEESKGLLRVIIRWAEKLCALLSTQTICVAPSLLEFARAEGIVGKNQGVVLANGMSNGINVTDFDPASVIPANVVPSDATVIGFVGRLARDKGILELCEAWKILRNEFPNTFLLMVGGWESDNPVSTSVREFLENDPRVHLAGAVINVIPYYRAMSVFVFPSHGTEGFPNAPMEAAAMELPVVATKVVGCVDAVKDGITGTIVPPQDAPALTNAVRRYLNEPDVGREQGRAGRARVLRDFSQPIIWEAIHQEYLRLLRSRSLSVPPA